MGRRKSKDNPGITTDFLACSLLLPVFARLVLSIDRDLLIIRLNLSFLDIVTDDAKQVHRQLHGRLLHVHCRSAPSRKQ